MICSFRIELYKELFIVSLVLFLKKNCSFSSPYTEHMHKHCLCVCKKEKMWLTKLLIDWTPRHLGFTHDTMSNKSAL